MQGTVSGASAVMVGSVLNLIQRFERWEAKRYAHPMLMASVILESGRGEHQSTMTSCILQLECGRMQEKSRRSLQPRLRLYVVEFSSICAHSFLLSA